jgi:vacuolar-type H+-ATPase subunit C/Vma6
MVVAAIHHKIPKENRIRELIPSPIHSSESLHLLASAESLDQFLEFLKGTDYASALREARKDYEQLGLPALVVALDKAYYRSLWSVAQKSKIDQRIIRPLIGYLIDAINVKTILRLKEVGASESEIDRYLVRPAHELSESMMRAMIAAEDLKSAIHAIRITTVGDVLLQATEAIAREGVIAAERALDEHYLGLCKQMELAHQFSVAPIISYIAHKESEFKKLRKCLRLKADKRPPEEIKKDLMAEVHAR